VTRNKSDQAESIQTAFAMFFATGSAILSLKRFTLNAIGMTEGCRRT